MGSCPDQSDLPFAIYDISLKLRDIASAHSKDMVGCAVPLLGYSLKTEQE